ncbi:MAG: hypothetical protein ACLTH3_06755 [Lachnospira sp.]
MFAVVASENRYALAKNSADSVATCHAELINEINKLVLKNAASQAGSSAM